MSLGLILIILLIIFLAGGFSGRFGGYGYGYGHSGVGVIGVILIVWWCCWSWGEFDLQAGSGVSRLRLHPESHLVAHRLVARRGARRQRRHRLDREPDRRRGGGGRDANDVLIAGVAGLVAGAMSMAAGEYVSVSSQSDTEQADLARERKELTENVEFEHDELADIYVKRGVDPDLARQVAQQLMAKDALAAHARDELGISEITTARPMQAALTSAATFSVGAAMPLLMVVVSPAMARADRIGGIPGLPCSLGAIGAKAGGANVLRATSGDVLGRLGDGADRWHRQDCSAPSYEPVGGVERSETHPIRGGRGDGFASAQPILRAPGFDPGCINIRQTTHAAGDRHCEKKQAGRICSASSGRSRASAILASR